MNILILTDYYPPDKLGGVGEIARNLKESYHRLGHEVTVLTTGQQKPEEAGQGVIRSSKNLIWGVFRNNFLAISLIKKHRIDLIHMHQSTTSLFLLAKLMYRSFPTVLNSFQVSYFSEMREIRPVPVAGKIFKPNSKEYVEKYLFGPVHIVLDVISYACSDVVTTVSSDNRMELERTFGRLFRRPLKIIPNGIDANRFSTAICFNKTQIEARLENKIVLTYIGVFRTRKRVYNLIYAFCEIARRHPNTVLLLIGGGRGYEDQIRNFIDDLGISDSIIMIGKIPNETVPYYLSLTDIFCLPSSYEGMPIAILEAMSMGKTVLTTNGYGMKDIFHDGDAGKLVAVDDLKELTSAIEKLVGDAELRQAIGLCAKEKALREYGWDIIARNYLKLV